MALGDELYIVPPTPPAAKCDGSGRVPDPGYNDRLCLGCPVCKPEPKKPPECDGSGNIPGYGSPWPCDGCRWCKPEPKDGAEEVVGPGVYYFGPDGTGAGNGTAIDITPNPRADREKQAARPATELDRYKVYELARRVVQNPNTTMGVADLAREVLAQLETP